MISDYLLVFVITPLGYIESDSDKLLISRLIDLHNKFQKQGKLLQVISIEYEVSSEESTDESISEGLVSLEDKSTEISQEKQKLIKVKPEKKVFDYPWLNLSDNSTILDKLNFNKLDG